MKRIFMVGFMFLSVTLALVLLATLSAQAAPAAQTTAQNPIVNLEHVKGPHKRQQIYEEAKDNGRCEARANGLGRIGQKRWTFRHRGLASWRLVV